MNRKEYDTPKGKAVFDYDGNGVGRITLECMDMIMDMVASSMWIPCSERLPEEVKTTYWICTDDGYQCQCRWTNVNPFWLDLTTDWHWNPYDAPQYSEVVAWMPLPQPYEGE